MNATEDGALTRLNVSSRKDSVLVMAALSSDTTALTCPPPVPLLRIQLSCGHDEKVIPKSHETFKTYNKINI